MSLSEPNETQVFTPRRERESLSDLRTVGPNKPVGYLSVPNIDKLGSTVDQEREIAIQAGLKTKFYSLGLPVTDLTGIGISLTWGGALYVYHQEALKELLEANRDLLKKHHWPTEPDKFINKIAGSDARPKTPFFDLVAKAFADDKNPGRLNSS